MKEILSYSWAYQLFQWMNGATKMRRILTKEYIKPFEGAKILDVACGTADILPYLKHVKYTGIDSNPNYISTNKKNAVFNKQNAVFICSDLNEFIESDHSDYDVILLMGIMHHLNDDELTQCLTMLHRVLKPNGRIVTLDGVYTKDLNFFERTLLAADRGKYVRTLEEWTKICEQYLPGNKVIRKDLYYLPYNIISGYRVSSL